MLHTIVDTLEACQDISGWLVREQRKTSWQRFFDLKGSEGQRKVESLAFDVEILVNHYPKRRSEEGATTGASRFTLDAASLGRLNSELSKAVAAASLVKNKPYKMVDPGPAIVNVALHDPALAGEGVPAVLEGLEQRLRAAAAAQAETRFATGELFAEELSMRLFNSQGLQSAHVSTLLLGEFYLLSGQDDKESEIFRAFKRRRLQDWHVEDEIAQAAEAGRRRQTARLPSTGEYDVALSGDALDHLFDPLLTQSSAAACYNRITEAKLGDMLVKAEPGADPLNLYHNAIIPYAVGSYRFDRWGSPGFRRLIVDGGMLNAYWADYRYAQYMNVPATGEAGCLEVDGGRSGKQELLKPIGDKPLLHLYEFSTCEPNAVTGELSAEIRLGELITPQGAIIPVKGGSVAISTRQAFPKARLSKERVQRDRYLGPEVVWLPGAKVAGD
jgi:hypothetical protein